MNRSQSTTNLRHNTAGDMKVEAEAVPDPGWRPLQGMAISHHFFVHRSYLVCIVQDAAKVKVNRVGVILWPCGRQHQYKVIVAGQHRYFICFHFQQAELKILLHKCCRGSHIRHRKA